MTDSLGANPFGDYEREMEQRVQRGEAIATVHSKLLFARSKDALLRDNNLDESHRFVRRRVREYGNVLRTHMKVMLVPPAAPAEQGSHNGIKSLSVEVPTDNKLAADSYERGLYLMNAEAQQVSSEALHRLDAEEMGAVPLQAFFAKATKQDGSTMRLLVTPDSIRAYDIDDDIQLIADDEAGTNQRYVVRDTLETIDTQRELEESWFTTEELLGYIRQAECFPFGDDRESNVA